MPPCTTLSAGSCAWQTPCITLGALPGVGLVHAVLVQVPVNDVVGSGGMPFVVKTSTDKWLQNGMNGKDFFFRSQQVGGAAGGAACCVLTWPAAAAAGRFMLH
jgi:hypothetical protein